MADDDIPKGRLRRSARLGTTLGVQGARYAGTRAAAVARSDAAAQERLAARHLETATRLAGVLGEMKGAAMKIGQLASFVDTEMLPAGYREVYQEQMAKLRDSAEALPWDKVAAVLDEEYAADGGIEAHFAEIEPEAFAAASIGQVHRGALLDGRRVAVKVQYPGVAEALEADLANVGLVVRLARALAPGLDPKAIAEELRVRVLEELDYEFEAQSQRIFHRAYRGHPFIHVPRVMTDQSRRRVLVSELVDGLGFEQVRELDSDERGRFGEILFRFSFGSIYHLQRFNADAHPGNYLLMEDGRVAFLDFGMTKQLEVEQIERERRAIIAIDDGRPDELLAAMHELGFVRDPGEFDAGELMEHVLAVGGWYLRDQELELTPELVMEAIAHSSDPRSPYYALMRRESIPADELLGRRMETGVLACLGRLGARRNWHRILREWIYADEPETELGRLEWEHFAERGVAHTPGIANRR